MTWNLFCRRPLRRTGSTRPLVRHFRPLIEQLEARSLLSGFAAMHGEVAAPAKRDVLEFHVDRADFSMSRRGLLLLGFEMHAADGSPLDPGRIRVQPQSRRDKVATLWHSSDTAGSGSVTLAGVRPGNFRLVVGGEHRTTGAYQVELFLVGDANGDNRVNKSDVQLIHALRGKRIGNPAYLRDADANRDGRINMVDETLARINRGVSTRIRPFVPTLELDPATDPEGDNIVDRPDIVLTGQAHAGVKVRLDLGADGSFEQETTGDPDGRFSISTTIGFGVTPIAVLLSGPFGQQATAQLEVLHPINPQRPFVPSVTLNNGAVAAVPGATHTLAWNFVGDISDFDLLIRARAPGNVLSQGGSYLVGPGSLPATGEQFYLAADGSWTTDEAIYGAAQPSGNVAFNLPSSAEGLWRLELIGRNRNTAEITSVTAQNILVSSGAAIHLSLNRTLANSSDAIRAELLTSSGQTPRPVRLVALLRLPDGRDVTLPDFEDRLEFLYEGPSRDARHVLLEQPLSLFGEGTYHLRVRLHDAETDQFLAMADADIVISDTPAALSGTLRDSSGQPLDATGARVATIQAFDVDDDFVTARSTPSASGGYQLDLHPGRYFITAFVVDAQGNAHSAHSDDIVVAGLAGSNPQLDLTATTTAATGVSTTAAAATMDASSDAEIEAALAALMAEGEAPPANPACGGLTPKKILIQDSYTGVPADHAREFVSILIEKLTLRSSCLEIKALSDVVTLGALAQQSQALGSDQQSNFQNGQLEAIAADLVLNFSAVRKTAQQEGLPLGLKATCRLVDVRAAANLSAGQATQNSTTNQENDLANLRTMVQTSAQDCTEGFDPSPTANRQLPERPTTEIVLSRRVALRGDLMNATIRVKDHNNTKSAGVQVRLEIELPEPKPDSGEQQIPPQTFTRVTDLNGEFTQQFSAGFLKGPAKVKATVIDAGRSVRQEPVSFYVIISGALTLFPFASTQRSGQSSPMQVRQLSADGFAVPLSRVDLHVDRGTLSTADGQSGPDVHVETDAFGMGDFVFTADGGNGFAQIQAQALQLGSGELLTDSVKIEVTGQVIANVNIETVGQPGGGPPVVFGGSAARVTVDVAIGGTHVAVQPVSLYVEGAGQLSDFEIQTNNLGLADTLYVAPSSGAGNAAIRVTAMVDGTAINESVTIQYRQQAREATIIDLGASFRPVAVNVSGQVAGNSGNRAFLYKDGQLIDLGHLGGNETEAFGINAAGDVVGTSDLPDGARRAFVYRNGVMTSLGTLGGRNSDATDINDAGQIVGHAHAGSQVDYAFLYSGGQMQSLGSLGPAWSEAHAINASGQVVGNYTTGPERRPFLYSNGQMTDIGTLGGISTFAFDINDAGQILGRGSTAAGEVHYFLYSNGQMIDLTTIGLTSVVSINNAGHLLGVAGTGANARAVLYKDGQMIDLDSLIPAGSGWTRLGASDMNDSGQIVGQGFLNNQFRGFLLTIP